MSAPFNLASRPYYRSGPARLLVLSGILFLFALFLIQLSNSLQLHQKEQLLRNQQSNASPGDPAPATKADLDLSPQEKARVDQNLNLARELLQRDSFHWTALFNQLEPLLPSQVRITTLVPREQGQSLQISGIAAGVVEMNDFLTALIASPTFDQVYLLGTAPLEGDPAESGLQFSLSCRGDF